MREHKLPNKTTRITFTEEDVVDALRMYLEELWGETIPDTTVLRLGWQRLHTCGTVATLTHPTD